MKLAGIAVLVAPVFALGSTPARASPMPSAQEQATPCSAGGAATRDLYCMSLTPAPGLFGIEAEVELGLGTSPFGIDIAPDGTMRYQPVLHVRGLPPASELGPFSTYIAWVASPTMFPIEKLGPVANGDNALPAIAMNKFVILITAESTEDVVERAGRIVLRGFSPSARKQPADLYEFAVGSGARDADPTHDHAMAGDWPRPPMPDGLTMLPALMQLEPPAATPYLPSVDDPSSIPMVQPRELARLEDGDTLALEARYVRRTLRGREFIAYGFNGQVPGPLIHVSEGAEIVVRFTNSIDWPTTIHWHGIRIDNRFDGVPGVTQEPVAPGDTFTYHVRFPDEGIYWYHPHHREDILKDLGLYGNILVRPPEPDYWSPANREEIVMLDDFLVGDGGPIPFGLERSTHTLMGRFGNVYLLNGEPRYALEVQAGEVVRFYFTNVSNTRTFNLSMPGARLKVVGSDIGGFERESWTESIVLAPAERYVVHARFDEPGTVALLNSVQSVDHLFAAYFPTVDTLGFVHVSGARVAEDLSEPFGTLHENGYVASDIAQYRDQFDRPVDRELELRMLTRDLAFVVGRLMLIDSVYFNPVEWSGTMPMMNWASTSEQVDWILRDPATGLENMEIDWRFRVGDVVKLRVRNERNVLHGMQHPLHIHGQRFLVLSMNGVPNQNLVWKDTVLLPAGSTADLLLEITNPGEWMIHCHISEHLEAGMRMTFIADPRE